MKKKLSRWTALALTLGAALCFAAGAAAADTLQTITAYLDSGITITLDGEQLVEVDLLAFTSVEASRIRILWRDVKSFFSTTAAKVGLGVVLVLAVIFGGWRLLFSRRRYRYGRSVGGGGRRGGYRGTRKRR